MSAPGTAMTITISHRSNRRQKTTPWLLFQQNPPLTLALLMALVVPLLPGPGLALPWDGASGAAFEAGGVLLLAAALWRADGPGLRRAFAFARRGPTPWLLGLAVWGALTDVLASGGNAALQGLLHLGAGLAVYAAVSYRVRKAADFRLVLDILNAVTLLVSALGIGSLLVTGSLDAGALTHRSFGALLMLLLPLVVLSAGAPGTPAQRGAGQAASVLGLLTLLLARWHPAERGALVAFLVLGLLCWRLGIRVWPSGGVTLLARPRAARGAAAARRASARRPGLRSGRRSERAAERRRKALGAALPGITIFCAAALFLALTPGGSAALRQGRQGIVAAARSHPLASVPSARFFRAVPLDHLLRGLSRASSGAARGDTPEGHQSVQAVRAMIKARPVLGWGLGCYVLFQEEWTHQGDEAAVVRRYGPQRADRARNAYSQMAVETGLPGLILWVASLAAFFACGGLALRRMGARLLEEGKVEPDPLRRRVLLGCLAAVAGQAVDAYSDGSWQSSGPSLFLWLVMGLGVAAAGGVQVTTGGVQVTAGDGPGGAALAQAGWRKHLRFAGVCVLSAVLLSLVVRASL